jgi:hypothetical protein
MAHYREESEMYGKKIYASRSHTNEERKCHMPCSHEGCYERCDKNFGHDPDHSCPVHGSF